MKVLVVGNGGREHALAWKLLQSPNIESIYCTPGNGGTALLKDCYNIPIAVDDFEGILKVIQDNQIDFVVVGPEYPLSLGITDYLQKSQIKVFGPTQTGAQLEASKAWAKTLMEETGVLTAIAQTFTDATAAKAYINQQGTPIVVKADQLAAGKGVIVALTLKEAHQAVDSLMGEGFNTLVIEEFLEGEEVSVLALTDGISFRSLLPAQDHKRIGEGDTGLNTGGMGAYCPAPVATPEILAQVDEKVLKPILEGLKQRGIDYRGVLYAGLMISPKGEVKVLEFNCRFGDPEIQAILPLLETPLDQLLLACIDQKLTEFPPIQWKSGSCICVVAASQGYPETYQKGKVIIGITEAEKLPDIVVFQAGTTLKDGKLLTDGGRVLGITATGDTFATAKTKVYQGVDQINFEGKTYRRDIGHRIL